MTSNSEKSQQNGKIHIELLAIDLNSCTRCVGSLGNIEKSIDLVKPILKEMNMRVTVKKTVVETEEQAERLQFKSSPTIRINGKDIVFETLETECDSCSDLCGCAEGTNCRVWNYRGETHNEAPVGLVVESILKSLFNQSEGRPTPDFEGVPDNLKRFFKSKTASHLAKDECCSTSKKEVCCEPSEKEVCCGTTESETCGCQ